MRASVREDSATLRAMWRPPPHEQRQESDMLDHAYTLREVSRYRIADLRAASGHACALLARLRLS